MQDHVDEAQRLTESLPTDANTRHLFTAEAQMHAMLAVAKAADALDTTVTMMNNTMERDRR